MSEDGKTDKLYKEMLADIRKNKACIALKYLLEFHRANPSAGDVDEKAVCDVIDYLGDVARGSK